MKRTICFVTGARSDYGLLMPIMKRLQSDADVNFQLIVTGTHLLPGYGLTWQQVERDGFVITKKVEMPLGSDSAVALTEGMGQLLMGLGNALEALKPDLLVVLGDRYEILVAATAALMARIPIAHLDGGELTEGVIDDAIRHSLTKLSHIHLTTAEIHRRRVIQLGEAPERVFNVGSTAVDNITSIPLLGRDEVEVKLGIKLKPKNLLITYYPETLRIDLSAAQFGEVLAALDVLQDTLLIFTKPAAEAGTQRIIKMIDEYVDRNPEKAAGFVSLGQQRYLSLLQYVDAVVGNSSSGLSEAPQFKKGTINIGTRQNGRLKAGSVIDCSPDRVEITRALRSLYSPEFQSKLAEVTNPYGSGDSADRIVSILKQFPLEGILQKRFYDLPWAL